MKPMYNALFDLKEEKADFLFASILLSIALVHTLFLIEFGDFNSFVNTVLHLVFVGFVMNQRDERRKRIKQENLNHEA